MTRVVGYTRELFAGEGTAETIDELEAAGAETVFADRDSAEPTFRPRLAACLAYVEPGDVLTVTSSDRLSHSRSHFVSTTAELATRGVLFRSLTEPAFTTGTPASSDPVQVLAAFDELSRRLRSRGTTGGLAAASADGRQLGRRTVMTAENIAIARELHNQGRSFVHIGRVLGVSKSAVHEALTNTPEDLDSPD